MCIIYVSMYFLYLGCWLKSLQAFSAASSLSIPHYFFHFVNLCCKVIIIIIISTVLTRHCITSIVRSPSKSGTEYKFVTVVAFVATEADTLVAIYQSLAGYSTLRHNQHRHTRDYGLHTKVMRVREMHYW